MVLAYGRRFKGLKKLAISFCVWFSCFLWLCHRRSLSCSWESSCGIPGATGVGVDEVDPIAQVVEVEVAVLLLVLGVLRQVVSDSIVLVLQVQVR